MYLLECLTLISFLIFCVHLSGWLSCDLTNTILIIPFLTYSLTKWYFTSICLDLCVLKTNCPSAIKFITIVHWISIPKKFKTNFINKISLLNSETVIYFASVDDNSTVLCSNDFHDTEHPTIWIQKTVTLKCYSLSPARS